MANWTVEIEKAEKYLQKTHTHGKSVYKRYKDERDDRAAGSRRVNMFYANVNTLKESLFNSLPKPDVSRLQKSNYNDEASRVAALLVQRALNAEIDGNSEVFTEAVEGAILDRLVPGIGQVWVRYTEGGSLDIDRVFWEDFLYSPSRSWKDVTWVGRRLHYTKEEVNKIFGEGTFDKIQDAKTRDDGLTPEQINENKTCIYEIWDKTDRTVIHTAKGLEEPLRSIPDPLQLKNFFPCPRPLIANVDTTAFLPVTDYHIAQDQYNDLDTIYQRICLLIEAVKVAGVYDAAETAALGRMLEGGQNKMIPVDNWAMFMEKGGAKGVVDWYPVEQVVQVLTVLQNQYENMKAVLYEITGMSDIMRGASNQYETAKAQQIKAQFASVRMNGYQRTVSKFVTGILQIMTEIMFQLYDDQKIMELVGEIDPADQEHLPAAAQILRNDKTLCYKVKVQADSLTQSDWALEKESRMELLGSTSQYLGAVAPLAGQSPQLAPMLLGLLKFAVSGFKGAAEVEGMMDKSLDMLIQQASQPQPPQPSPEEQKAQAEMQKMQADAQIKQMEAQQSMQLEQQKAQMQMQMEQQKLEFEKQKYEMELYYKQRIAEIDLQTKQQSAQIKAATDIQSAAIKSQQAEQQARMKEEDHERRQTENSSKSEED